MNRKEIRVGGRPIYIEKFGSGTRTLICFNGYGRVASELKVLENSIGRNYSVIAVNHHMHDGSEWVINDDDVSGFCEQLISELGLANSKFDILGYSIGARMAICLANEMKSAVDKVYLLAPEGLYSYPLFDFMNKTKLGQRLFRFLIKSPGIAFLGLKFTQIIGVYSKATTQYYYNRFNTLEKRNRLKQVWRIMSKVTLDKSTRDTLFSDENIEWVIVLGEQDNVISSRKVKRNIAAMARKDVHELPVGHSLLFPKMNDHLGELFQ
jgi:pimeloyl-ACP methyl ester carboxylesterase